MEGASASASGSASASSPRPHAQPDRVEEALVNVEPGRRPPQVLACREDGSRVEARFAPRSKILVEVVRQTDTSTKTLGEIVQMLDFERGHESLQARCRVHSRCICWFSNANHCDLLAEWLSNADLLSIQEHQTRSKELKRSIGMKVRG